MAFNMIGLRFPENATHMPKLAPLAEIHQPSAEKIFANKAI